jgi:hypothetical protein
MNKISRKTQEIINSHNMADFIKLTPCPWILVYSFLDNKETICNGHRTYFLQEMIKEGVLFQGFFVSCLSHTSNEVNYFCAAFEEALKRYKKMLKTGFTNFLEGESTKSVFRKYN